MCKMSSQTMETQLCVTSALRLRSGKIQSCWKTTIPHLCIYQGGFHGNRMLSHKTRERLMRLVFWMANWSYKQSCSVSQHGSLPASSRRTRNYQLMLRCLFRQRHIYYCFEYGITGKVIDRVYRAHAILNEAFPHQNQCQSHFSKVILS